MSIDTLTSAIAPIHPDITTVNGITTDALGCSAEDGQKTIEPEVRYDTISKPYNLDLNNPETLERVSFKKAYCIDPSAALGRHSLANFDTVGVVQAVKVPCHSSFAGFETVRLFFGKSGLPLSLNYGFDQVSDASYCRDAVAFYLRYFTEGDLITLCKQSDPMQTFVMLNEPKVHLQAEDGTNLSYAQLWQRLQQEWHLPDYAMNKYGYAVLETPDGRRMPISDLSEVVLHDENDNMKYALEQGEAVEQTYQVEVTVRLNLTLEVEACSEEDAEEKVNRDFHDFVDDYSIDKYDMELDSIDSVDAW